MNDLLSSPSSTPDHHIEMEPPLSSSTTAGDNLQNFFQDVESINDELRSLETLYNNLQSSHEQSKTLHNAQSIKNLRSKMDNDVALSLKTARLIKQQLEILDRSNEANRRLAGYGGPGSATDRTRTSVVNGLRKKSNGFMIKFNSLRDRMNSEYRETVQRRYYTVTGENPDESTVDNLIATGQSETFLQKAIAEQGRGRVMDTIMEIQERHDAVREMERNLKELHQVFMDMAVLVQSQGEELDDIEAQVQRAQSVVQRGVTELTVAKKHQTNTRKWTCYAIILLLVVILIVVLSLKPWNWKK